MSGILKTNQESEGQHQHPTHIKFDEETIAEHDKERGTRQRIEEPKTPYQYDESEQQEQQQVHQDVQMSEPSEQKGVEEEIKKHLQEAERNKMLNAQLAQLQKESADQEFSAQLQEKLDQTQSAINEEEKKHQEFLKKRKEHYKNEFSPAMLLKQKAVLEDDEEEQKK